MKHKIILLLLIFTINNIMAQVVHTTLDTPRDKTELLTGFNRRSDNGSWWDNNSFISNLADIHPEILRFPGGTQANYWDWQTGAFIPNTRPMGNREVLLIPDFTAAIPTDTKIVYVVNLARPTPATGVAVNAPEADLKSLSTLNSKIDDMLNAIAAFGNHLPYAIEIGNEFYFGNEEAGIFHIEERADGLWYSGWNPNTNQAYAHNTKKEATVTNAKFYLDQCKVVVSRIKSAYPNMKFVLISTKSGNGNSTRERWNQTIFDELNNNPQYAQLKQDVYALTQHHYLNDNYGMQTTIHNIATAKTAIAEGITYPIERNQDYVMVPNDYKIWLTEYGETKRIAEETWAAALRYIALNMSWINRGDKIGQLGFHHVSDNNVMNTTDGDINANTVHQNTLLKKAPVGMAAEMFLKASFGMDEMQRINFTNNSISTTVNNIDVYSLYGYKFKSNDKETLLIININNSAKNIEIDNLLTYSGTYQLTQYYSDTPYVEAVYEGHPNIQSINSTNPSNTITVPNFSITLVERLNTSSVIDFHHQDNVIIYPNPATNMITIKANLQLTSILIRDAKGKLIKEIQKPKNKLNISQLKAGVYLIELNTGKQKLFYKLIKQH